MSGSSATDRDLTVFGPIGDESAPWCMCLYSAVQYSAPMICTDHSDTSDTSSKPAGQASHGTQ